MSTIEEQIHQLSQYRQTLWAQRMSDPVETARVERALTDLYELRRKEQAQNRHGSRKEIFHRARIEYELEKLMSEGDGD